MKAASGPRTDAVGLAVHSAEFKVQGHVCAVEFAQLQQTDRFKHFANAFGLISEGCNYRAPRFATRALFEETALRFFNTVNAQKDGSIANLAARETRFDKSALGSCSLVLLHPTIPTSHCSITNERSRS